MAEAKYCDGVVEYYCTLYNSNNENHTEDVEMSYCGIIVFKNKIIGFADSKCSKTVNGNLMINEDREYIKKIFMHPKYMTAFTGGCVFGTVAVNEYMRVYLEDWILGNISKYNNPTDLYNGLFQFVSHDNLIRFDKIRSLAVMYDDIYHAPIIFEATITKDSILIEKISPPRVSSYCIGNEQYVDYFSNNPERLYTCNTESIKQELERYEREVAKQEGYSSVGSPWVVEVFEPKEDI